MKRCSRRLMPAIVIFCGLSSGNIGFAERVILKSGTAVEGDILATTDSSITLDFYGTEMTIYRDEIDSIEGVASSQKGNVVLKPVSEPDSSQDFTRQEIKNFIEGLNITLRAMKAEIMDKENLIRDLRGRQEREKLLAVTKNLSAAIQKFAEDIRALAIPKGCQQLSVFAIDYMLAFSTMYDQLYEGDTAAASSTQALLQKHEADLYREMALVAARHNIRVLFP